MHDHITHKDLAVYAAAKVNLPSVKAKARREQVAHLRKRLESYIDQHPDYSLVKMRASGSVAKHTAINSSSDTDIAAYVRASAVGGVTVDESTLLEWLRDRCIQVYGATKDVSDFEISQHAVAITMHGSGLKIDVAPVVYEGQPDDLGHLVTPNGERVLTSVTLHLRFLKQRKDKAGTEYRELIRLIKQFIYRAKLESSAVGTKLRFKSFLAELIVAYLYDNGWNGEPLAVKDYLRAFEQFLGYIVQTGLKQPIMFDDYYDLSEIAASTDPVQVWDPVNPANNVASSYTDHDRQRIVDRCSQALDQVTWAGMTPSKTEAVAAWRTLFGPSFPGV